MSVRSYTGPYADRRRHGPTGPARWLPWLLAVGVVGLQIAFVLVHGSVRRDVTVATVVAFFLASAVHALVWRGAWWTAGYLLVTVGGGLAVEAVGVRTGVPFGRYEYGTALGSTVLEVPWLVPLAWAMMAYPALVAARRLSRSPVVTPLLGALALASWDLFLDPMMTAEGYWTFSNPSVVLRDVPGIPVANFLGWLATALVMMLLLDRLPRRSAPDGQPAFLYLWTYLSSVVANVFFFHRPAVALYGGVAMGLIAVPYAWALWSGRD